MSFGRADRKALGPKSDRELVSFLGNKIEQAMNDEDGDISDVRIENYNYYVGKPYGNERQGYSSIVTREALETVEWALPAVLKAFVGDSRVVSYEAIGKEDEPQADQETDIARHYLLRKGNGFVTLHNWVKDAMMFPNGYVELAVQEEEKTRVEHYRGLSEMGLQQLLVGLASEEKEVEVLEQEVSYREDPLLGPVEEYEIRIRVTWTEGFPKWCAVPGDELLIDNDCLSLDLDEADFVCRRQRKSYTQLVNEGKDPDQLDKVGASEDYQWLDERTNRLFYEDEDPDSENEDDPSMQEFWVHNCYAWVDTDGDGLAEFRHIEMIGAEIFVNDEVDYQPYVSAAAIMLPHKHSGLSFIDIVKDLQLIRSTLWRELLNNTYKLNVRRKYVGDAFISDEGGTLDVLFDNQSEFIPAKDPTAIQEEMVQPIVSDILPVIQSMGDLQAVRTGITPEFSLDPQTLQQSTMGAFGAALEQASERVQMFVRIFAETGWRTVMLKMHQLMREHVDRPLALKLRGDWVEVNPAHWHERTDVDVKVGLGFSKPDVKLMLLDKLLEYQKEALVAGMARPDKIYNTLEDMVECAGLGHASKYFVDPSSAEYQPPQPQPDPMVLLAQRDMEIKERGQQQDFFMDQQKLKQETEEMFLKYGDMQIQVAKLVEEVKNLQAERDHTMAQAQKTMTEAQAQDIENSEVTQAVRRLTKEG